MLLIEALNLDTISVHLEVKNRKQLIESISNVACLNPILNEITPEILSKSLLEREELASTGLGNGVALPHCRLPGLSTFVIGIVTTKKAIDFDSIDNEMVDIFPFVIGPQENPKEHLKVLSGVARLLRNPDTRANIRKTQTPTELYSLIKNLLDDYSLAPSSQVPKPGMKMLHVFVRDEELFNDILQVFASDDLTGAMVIEAHESTEYMSSMPVFAGFWNSDLNTFNRIIIAVVKDSLFNQTVRNIEYVCGDLQNQTDVMVTVTDLHHALGSLEF